MFSFELTPPPFFDADRDSGNGRIANARKPRSVFAAPEQRRGFFTALALRLAATLAPLTPAR